MNNKVYLLKMIYYRLRKNKNKSMQLKINRLRGQGASIGNDVRIFSKIDTPEPYLLQIGNNVTISTSVSFITHDNSITKILPNKSDVFGKIIIGDNSFIGLGSILMPGVELGANTIVGSGSVVTKSFKEGNVIIAGNPARVVKAVSSYAESIAENAFDFKGVSNSQRKEVILKNSDKLLAK
ncbi:acyltransferase [Peribacillus sp. NPDC055009]